MHEVYIQILVNTIHEQYNSEKSFYENILGADQTTWEAWKAGKGNLTAEQNQKIKNLFSDYEWMLLQKILRQTIIFPEKRTVAISEYKKMKTKIAQKWLSSNLATAEMISYNEEGQEQQYLDLKVTITYDEWGFDDILNFRLPAVIQQQIKNEKVALLNWVNENLEDAYTK